MSIRRAFTAAVAVFLLTVSGTLGQELPQTPDPALCTLEARAIDNVESLVDDAANQPDPPTPTSVPDPFVMPDGFSLVEDERIEIEKDLIRAIACVNTGNPLKVFATYTDRYIVELIEQLGGMTDQVVSGLLTVRELSAEQRLQVISIDDAILLHDGRALVVVTGDNPADEQPAGQRAFYLEEVVSGRWLVDEIVEISTQA